MNTSEPSIVSIGDKINLNWDIKDENGNKEMKRVKGKIVEVIKCANRKKKSWYQIISILVMFNFLNAHLGINLKSV